MSYEELSLSSFIKEIKDVTTGTHPRKFCFVLGAGASRTSGIKSGQDLVKIWDIELRERNIDGYNLWRTNFGITDDNMYSFYSKYYEKRFKRCPSDGYNYIEKIMSSAKPSVGYVMLAYILTKTTHNVVITTNFDHLTEDAVNYYAQGTPLVIGHESLSHYILPNPMRPTIIKIHRDLLFDPKSRTEDLEELAENWKTSLSSIFKNYHPIFIGYAGNDNSLMDFLIENSENFANDKWRYPYWMLYENDKLEGKTLDFVSKCNGQIVYHAGFDDVMIQLGEALEYKTPTEDEFLKDAKKRYKSLADAIDAFSDKSKKTEIVVAVDENTSKKVELVDEDNSSKEGIAAIQKIASQSQMQRQYHLAINEMDNENYERAEEIFLQLISQDPENSRYLKSYSKVLVKQGKFDDALKQLDKAVKLDHNDEMSHYLRGDAFESLKEYEDALKEYRIAVALKPEDEINHFKVANMLEELERYDEALSEYRIAVELDPENGIFYFAIGNTLEELGKYEEALKEYRTAVELDPKDDVIHFGIARMLEKLGKFEEALGEYQIATELNPEDEFNHWKTGYILWKLGRYEEALKKYKTAIELKPEEALFHFSVGNVLDELGEYEEALKEYRIANQYKVEVLHYLSIGNVLEILDQNDEAIEQYTKALELDDKEDLCYWRLAHLYNKSQKHEEALKNINIAIDIDGNSWKYYETLALILNELGKKDEAKKAIEKATSLKKESNL